MAISRKGNVGNEHAPASSPAVAHRRAKRTEWRMRGIEPYNKIIVVFPSSVLPSQCFGNPPSPEGEGLIGCVHDCHLGVLVEKSPAVETKPNIHDYFKILASAIPTVTPFPRNNRLYGRVRRLIRINHFNSKHTPIPPLSLRACALRCYSN